jgi:transposase
MENDPVMRDTFRQTDLPEKEMINQDKHGAVVELAGRGTPKKAIARMLGIGIKSVRRILRREKWKPYKRRPPAKTVLTGHEEFLTRRAPEVGFNCVVLFRELKLMGYNGGYPAVQRFVKPLREAFRRDAEATLRFETAPGLQGQVDWGSSYVWFDDRRVRVRFFALVLGYSRRMFAKAFPSERLVHLIQGHEAAFSWLGGFPRELLYDNPKTMVTGRDAESEEVQLNPTFQDFVRHYGFRARFCHPYRAQTKGKIESGIKYIKGNFLVGRRFRDLDDLNCRLEEWMTTVADVRIHGTTGVRPIDRFQQEKLLPFGHVPPYRLENAILRKIPTDARVCFKTNRYSVPWRLIGQQVEVRVEDGEVVLLQGDQVVARHALLSGRFQESVDPAHFRGLFRTFVTDEPNQPPHDPRFPVEDVMVRDLSLYDQVAGIGGAV